MAFQNDSIGGVTLVRPAIRSANYVPGVSGWSINRDGSAEFASGTFRGPVIVQDPTTQAFLASIGATGNVTGQIGQFNDVLIGNPGQSILTTLNAAPQGNVSSGFIGSGALAGGASNAFTNNWWIPFFNTGKRFYHIYSSPMIITNPAASAKRFAAQYAATSPGGGGFTGAGSYVEHTLAAGAEYEFILDWFFFFSGAGAQNITFQLNGIDSSAVTCSSTGLGLFVDDVGSGPLLFNEGGAGSPPNIGTVTKQYFCTDSRVYDDSGAQVTAFGTNDIAMGQWNGVFQPYWNSIWCFNGAQIRSDLSGASNISGKMYMYAYQGQQSVGSINFDVLTNTTCPTTYSATRGSGDWKLSNIYPFPAYSPIDIFQLNDAGTQTLLQAIIAGGNAIAPITSFFASDGTRWHGLSNATNTRPYLEITYTK